MNDNEFKDAVAKYAKENEKIVGVLFGGDGTLVGRWRAFRARKGAKPLLPIRDYGLCQKHKELYAKMLAGAEDCPPLKQFLFPVLRGEFQNGGIGNYLDALSELAVISMDPTAALRFNIKVNGNTVVENAIANGVVVATKLGSTGYFKSIARTIFFEGTGIGFICPTYSIPNIVTKTSDRIEFELRRDAELVVTADKLRQNVTARAGWSFTVQDACENIPIIGYDWFMCPDCRRNRNSTLVNDNYCIV